MKTIPQKNGMLQHGMLVLGLLAAAGCRGDISSAPPIHVVLDMDFQQKVKAQAESPLASHLDGRGMRTPAADTVARGSLPDPALANRDAAGAFVTKNPLPISEQVLARGKESFEIHCAICHGYSGQGGNGTPESESPGHGIVGRRWPVTLPNFHVVEGADNRVPQMPDGEFFEVISNGKGTMPAYGPRIAPEDRWAIVHYIRVLQSLTK
jgi:mono/diheme cytochrome c family protein